MYYSKNIDAAYQQTVSVLNADVISCSSRMNQSDLEKRVDYLLASLRPVDKFEDQPVCNKDTILRQIHPLSVNKEDVSRISLGFVASNVRKLKSPEQQSRSNLQLLSHGKQAEGQSFLCNGENQFNWQGLEEWVDLQLKNNIPINLELVQSERSKYMSLYQEVVSGKSHGLNILQMREYTSELTHKINAISNIENILVNRSNILGKNLSHERVECNDKSLNSYGKILDCKQMLHSEAPNEGNTLLSNADLDFAKISLADNSFLTKKNCCNPFWILTKSTNNNLLDIELQINRLKKLYWNINYSHNGLSSLNRRKEMLKIEMKLNELFVLKKILINKCDRTTHNPIAEARAYNTSITDGLNEPNIHYSEIIADSSWPQYAEYDNKLKVNEKLQHKQNTVVVNKSDPSCLESNKTKCESIKSLQHKNYKDENKPGKEKPAVNKPLKVHPSSITMSKKVYEILEEWVNAQQAKNKPANSLLLQYEIKECEEALHKLSQMSRLRFTIYRENQIAMLRNKIKNLLAIQQFFNEDVEIIND